MENPDLRNGRGEVSPPPSPEVAPRWNEKRWVAGASSESGFTIAELITVVAIIGVLASVAMPVVSFGLRRQKELELHERIRRITDAIDRYHELRMTNPPNNIKKPPDFGQREYPKNLEELTKPIELNSGKSVRPAAAARSDRSDDQQERVGHAVR